MNQLFSEWKWNGIDKIELTYSHERPPCESSEMGVAIGGKKVEEFCPKEQ